MNPERAQMKLAQERTAMDFAAQFLVMMATHIDRAVTLPTEYDFTCPICPAPILEVYISHDKDGHGHALPCGCVIQVTDMETVFNSLQLHHERNTGGAS